ncbi:MAG: endolytic transglycosylase MltG, partial [Paludibacteraceae bacterium]|nr:endolytic transglycosylase MltG [Paludibacteraceae bacterium]
PIRIPSANSIDAVLNYEHHNYYYMCAKSDFSGTHDYATTFLQHSQNARKYQRELNKKGIR